MGMAEMVLETFHGLMLRRPRHATVLHRDGVTSVAFSHDSRFFATGSSDRTAQVHSLESKELLFTVNHGRGARVLCVAFSPDSRFLATGSSVRTAQFHSLESKALIFTVNHGGPVTSVAFSDDSRFLATGSEDKTAQVHSLESKELLFTVNHGGRVTSVAFSPDSRFLATGSEDKTAQVHSLESKDLRFTVALEQKAECVCFSGDGKMLGVTSSKMIYLWDVDDEDRQGLLFYQSHRKGADDLYGWLPILDLFLASAQVAGLALTKAVPWNQKAIAPVATPLKIALFDITIPNPDPSDEFYVKSFVALSGAALCVCLALCRALPSVVKPLSTFVVLPLIKQIVRVFDCWRGELDGMPQGTTIVCYKGWHTPLACVAFVIGAAYVFVLMPLSAAGGDIEDLVPYVWVKPSQWLETRKRRAETQDDGYLQPESSSIRLTAYIDLLVKIGVPAVHIFTTHDPLKQMALSTIMTLFAVFVACGFKPYKDPFMSDLVCGVKAMQFLPYLCGLVAVLFFDETSIVPAAMLYCLLILPPAVCWWRCKCLHPRTRGGRLTMAGLLYGAKAAPEIDEGDDRSRLLAINSI